MVSWPSYFHCSANGEVHLSFSDARGVEFFLVNRRLRWAGLRPEPSRRAPAGKHPSAIRHEDGLAGGLTRFDR